MHKAKVAKKVMYKGQRLQKQSNGIASHKTPSTRSIQQSAYKGC